MGRDTSGVKGMNVAQKGNYVLAMDIARDDTELLVVTENGFGKRSAITDYPVKGRGTMGVQTIKLTDKKGALAGAMIVREHDELVFISQNGMVQRTAVKGISLYGRASQGVNVMNLRDDDMVSAVALVMEGTAETAAKVEEDEPTAELEPAADGDTPPEPEPSRTRLGRGSGRRARAIVRADLWGPSPQTQHLHLTDRARGLVLGCWDGIRTPRPRAALARARGAGDDLPRLGLDVPRHPRDGRGHPAPARRRAQVPDSGRDPLRVGGVAPRAGRTCRKRPAADRRRDHRRPPDVRRKRPRHRRGAGGALRAGGAPDRERPALGDPPPRHLWTGARARDDAHERRRRLRRRRPARAARRPARGGAARVVAARGRGSDPLGRRLVRGAAGRAAG